MLPRYDESTDWVCEGYDRCWSRARESNADGEPTGESDAADGSFWAFVESSNDGYRSAVPNDSNPGRTFTLSSPAFPESLGDGRGLLWPPSCDLALAFDYSMYGAEMGTLKLVASGCFDDDGEACAVCGGVATGGFTVASPWGSRDERGQTKQRSTLGGTSKTRDERFECRSRGPLERHLF